VIRGTTADALIAVVKIIPRTDSSRLEVRARESPTAGTKPAYVFQRIAPVFEFQVYYGGESGVVHEIVPGAKISVAKHPITAGWCMSLEPSQTPLKHGIRHRTGIEKNSPLGY